MEPSGRAASPCGPLPPCLLFSPGQEQHIHMGAAGSADGRPETRELTASNTVLSLRESFPSWLVGQH